MANFTGFEHIVRENELLAPFTWLRIGGAAQYFAEPTSIDELKALVQRCLDEEVPVRLLGGGSNLLVRDRGMAGLVVHLAAPSFCEIRRDKNGLVAGGGCKLNHVIATSVREGFAGLEQLVGIPGTVGGALHGNAGTPSCDVGQFTASATVMTAKGIVDTREKEDLQFQYRRSSLDEFAILEARFELESDDPAALMKRMQKQWIVTNASRPSATQGTGLLFKDPGGISAGSLIESAGLKGATVGGAAVSEKDPNFVVIRADATADDVIRLIEIVRNGVIDQSGVELEPSIEIW